MNSLETILMFAVIAFGVPHGAADLYLGRTLLKNWPWPLYLGLYILLVGLVYLAWHFSLQWAFPAFMLVSAWHFGETDFQKKSGAKQALGGLLHIVFLLAVHLQEWKSLSSNALASVLPSDSFIPWIGMICTLAWVVFLMIHNKTPRVFLLLGISMLGILLPFFVHFTLYFLIWHTPHSALAVWKTIRNFNRTFLLSVSFITLSAWTMFALAWNWFPQHEKMVGLLGLLAALTLPHALIFHLVFKRLKT